MKLIVCESCEAEYKIQHDMNERYYVVSYCVFCGEELGAEHVDEIVGWEEED